MGELLTVNFCQPSHEFTFSVGIDLISKLTILTLMIYQVHTRMWFLEFIVYIGLRETSRESSSSTLCEDREARHKSRHEVNMTPSGPRTEL
jgi:hypothetical protein